MSSRIRRQLVPVALTCAALVAVNAAAFRLWRPEWLHDVSSVLVGLALSWALFLTEAGLRGYWGSATATWLSNSILAIFYFRISNKYLPQVRHRAAEARLRSVRLPCLPITNHAPGAPVRLFVRLSRHTRANMGERLKIRRFRKPQESNSLANGHERRRTCTVGLLITRL
jgi:hypothetical protein